MKVFAALTLALLTGCAARQPAAARPQGAAYLVAPPECVVVKSALLLDAQGRPLKKQKVTFTINCTEVRK